MNRPAAVTEAWLADVVNRLAGDRAVRRALPGWGRLVVDRQLPFIVFYRRPVRRPDKGTERLVIGSASYVLADGSPAGREVAARVVRAIAEAAVEEYGAFLVVEVWAGPETDGGAHETPAYAVHRRFEDEGERTIDELVEALRGPGIRGARCEVTLRESARIGPRGMRPLFTQRQLASMRVMLVGLEVRPVYRDPVSGEPFPVLLRQSGRRVTTAIDRAAYRFTRTRTSARPKHYHALGKRAFTSAVRQVDEQLAQVAAGFDVLLQVTPVNSEQAWTQFRRSRFEKQPEFHYRPLPFDPGRMKHRLWGIRPERVEDPTLYYLFRDVQVDLDRRLSLVSEIGTPAFLQTGVQLFGSVDADLADTAERILRACPPRPPRKRAPRLTADEFAGLAASEILCYREEHPHFGVMPQVRSDIYAGIMVSRGHILVGAQASVPLDRADALIQHEIGTHVVTHYNGGIQRLKLMRSGLPGYDETQEGLAVLAEYLVGGLDTDRRRVLAGRALAVRSLLDGAGFVETFRMLVGRGFTQRSAFTITTRVHRGGGLPKDAMYLRGLLGIVDYVVSGHDLDRLFLGKFALVHMPVVEELLMRQVLSPPLALPRYLSRPDSAVRLARLRDDATSFDLTRGKRRRT